MKRTRNIWPVTCLLVLLSSSLVSFAAERRRNSDKGAPPAAGSAVAPKQGFETFQLILERNIFNPSRVGRLRIGPEEKPQRVDEISLVGTVRYDNEKLAIFDSPNSAYRKAFREGEMVADFKVESVTAEGVQLMRESKPLSLKVAQQLRRVEGADWTVTLNQAVQLDPRALTATAAGSAKPPEAASTEEIPADASEVLKRLMKKREKQLK